MQSLLLRQSPVIPPTWSPLLLSPLMWLDASDTATITESGGVVSQWNDKSGNGNNATQGSGPFRPSYSATGLDGQPAVTTDGNKIMARTLTGVAALTNKLGVFVVALMENLLGSSDGRLVSMTDINLVNDDFTSNSAAAIMRAGATEAIRARRSGANLSEQSVVYDSPFVAGSVFDGTNQTMYVNGVGGSAVSSSTNFSSNPVIALLGNFNDTPTYWIGALSEVIVVIGDISTEDRQRIEGYMAHRWGIAGNLPSDHPFKNVAP